MKAGVFFERDGILNQVRTGPRGQQLPPTLDDFEVNPAALQPLRQLKSAGLILLATTNQSGLSHGDLSRRDLDWMHAQLRRKLPLDDILVCPHDEMDQCPCRKPSPGLLTEAAFKWHLDLERSFVVSDKWQDAQAAHSAGARSLLVKSPWNGTGHRDFILPDLPTIADKILHLQTCGHGILVS